MISKNIKTIEEWYEVKASEFIDEFETWYRANANLELHIETQNKLTTELNNTDEFVDKSGNKISKLELECLKLNDQLPKPSGMMALLGFGAQDYWLCPNLPYGIGGKTLYKTEEYLAINDQITKVEELIEVSKMTMSE